MGLRYFGTRVLTWGMRYPWQRSEEAGFENLWQRNGGGLEYIWKREMGWGLSTLPILGSSNCPTALGGG